MGLEDELNFWLEEYFTELLLDLTLELGSLVSLELDLGVAMEEDFAEPSSSGLVRLSEPPSQATNRNAAITKNRHGILPLR